MRALPLIAVGVVAATLIATPVAAAASTDPPEAEFLTHGEVELHTATEGDADFEPGTVYWEVQLRLDNVRRPFVATWERAEGAWSSADEAKAHLSDAGIIAAIEESRQCQLSRIREIAATTASYEEFRALSGESGDGWDLTPEMWQEIGDACAYEPADTWEWVWDHTPTTRDEESEVVTARIPLDVLGPGEHELFVAPYRLGYDPAPESDQLCRVYDWPDGGWAGHACRFSWMDTATTTVIVPEPPQADAGASGDAPDASGAVSPMPIVLGVGIGLVVLAGIAVLVIVLSRRRARP